MKNAVLVGVFLITSQSLLAAEVSATEAASHVGDKTVVCGAVTGVHTAAASRGKPTFIDFDKMYPNEDFVVVILG